MNTETILPGPTGMFNPDITPLALVSDMVYGVITTESVIFVVEFPNSVSYEKATMVDIVGNGGIKTSADVPGVEYLVPLYRAH